jgi:hypothetical protein
METLGFVLAGIASVAATIGLLWLVIRVVRHAWKGAVTEMYTADVALQKVRSAVKELRSHYPGVADNFSNGLAVGVFETLGLNDALNLSIHKLDSGDLTGAREEISRIKEWYDEVEGMISMEREQAGV